MEAQPLKYCSGCRDYRKHTDFQLSGNTRCRLCVQEAVYTTRRDSLRGYPVPVAIKNCPVCAMGITTSDELRSHLQAEHTVTSGSKMGRVLGLDATMCLICKRIFKEPIMSHLAKFHGLAGDAYLKLYPHAVLHVLRSSDMGEGRSSVGQRRRLSRKFMNERGEACPLCGTIPDDMVLHQRRSHGLADEDYHRDHNGPNVALVHKILDLRTEADRTWMWPSERKRVYFVQAGHSERPIKIGFSQRIHQRMRSFQTDAPDRLVVLLTMFGGYEEEAILHERFAPLNHRREWFRPEPELLRFILETACDPPVEKQVAPPLTPMDRMWATIRGDEE